MHLHTGRGLPMKLSPRAYAAIVAVTTLAILVSTDQIVPPTTAYQAEMRIWLVGRATGITTLVLLTGLVVVGLLLSHPHQPDWKQARRIYPLHEALWVFSLAFLVVHVASLAADPYAGVGWGGALIPGASSYRTPAVALGTFGAYALLVTGLTARLTRLLPNGWWLKLHRLAVVAFVLGWSHGMLAGTDSVALVTVNAGLGGAVLLSAVYRYWVMRRQRRRETAQRSAVAPGLAGATSTPRPAPTVDAI